MDGGETQALVSEILNHWWMVRHYALQRTATERLRRAQAVQKLGLTIRRAFNSSDDFEVLIAAVLDGGRPRDERPF